MRTFDDLTPAQQDQAVRKVLCQHYLELVCAAGGLAFGSRAINSAIEEAIQEAERMQTPWFAHEYIMEAEYQNEYGATISVGEFLTTCARDRAEKAFYPNFGEVVIEGIH